MTHNNKKLSFTFPVLVSFTGMLFSFTVIAVFIIFTQGKDLLERYHDINRNFTHNLAVNYTESLLHENDYILGRAATYFSRNDNLNTAINVTPADGMITLMQLQTLMPSVSSVSLADTEGHYLRVPESASGNASTSFDVTKRPWFVKQAESSTLSRYTPPYLDDFTQHHTVTLYRPVISPEGRLKGSIAFHLDLDSMGYTLRQMVAPVQGEFFVVDRAGQVILHSDTGVLLSTRVSAETMSRMTDGEGHLYDPGSNSWYYYYSFTSPDWFVIYRVAAPVLSELPRHQTSIVIWGFTLAGIMIILFGLYLRHTSHSVLMNIINAIKSGNAKHIPSPEAVLSKAIESSKARELSYARQATIDALTGCKNRRAFDNDIATLLNSYQPFALALVDIDNFKSINDTWGHLNGDIVLRSVAREGIQILQPYGISLYRYGGEEFAVLFSGECIREADMLLETWRIQVDARVWREEGLHVTFSAGLGEWKHETQEQLIEGVDKTLYMAKKQGKNRILRGNPE